MRRTYTKSELAEYNRLLIDTTISTKKNAERDLDQFVKQQGKEKCASMYAQLTGQNGALWAA